MVWDAMPPGSSSGIHVHVRADEFFYVIEGNGAVLVKGKEAPIEPGDVIFVPKGEDHKIRNVDSSRPLTVIYFLDKPGLVDQFRAHHERLKARKAPLTLEELNAISRKLGTIYKTLE